MDLTGPMAPWHLATRGLRRRAIMAAPLLVLATVGVGGCSTSSDSASRGTTTSSSPFAHLGAVPRTVDGATFDPASLSGKPVVLWFWAPWCTICRAEAPTVSRVAAEYAGRVQFVGIAGQDTATAMSRFVTETGTGDLTHLADTTGVVWREFGVAVQPSFAFITSDGTTDIRVGGLEEQALRARVAEVAAGDPRSSITVAPGPTCSKAPDGTLLCGSAGPGQTPTTLPPAPAPSP